MLRISETWLSISLRVWRNDQSMWLPSRTTRLQVRELISQNYPARFTRVVCVSFSISKAGKKQRVHTQLVLPEHTVTAITVLWLERQRALCDLPIERCHWVISVHLKTFVWHKLNKSSFKVCTSYKLHLKKRIFWPGLRNIRAAVVYLNVLQAKAHPSSLSQRVIWSY